MAHQVSFQGHPEFPPVSLEPGSNLSEHLTVVNSPVLFGCRTGICGTCLIEVCAQSNGSLAPQTDNEKDLLPIIAPSTPHARLACQIEISADITIRPIEAE